LRDHFHLGSRGMDDVYRATSQGGDLLRLVQSVPALNAQKPGSKPRSHRSVAQYFVADASRSTSHSAPKSVGHAWRFSLCSLANKLVSKRDDAKPHCGRLIYK